MREIIIPFIPRVTGDDGVRCRVQVIGREREDGSWEVQIEFSDDGKRLQGVPRGSAQVQPNEPRG
jgi:hypothetical protein